MMSLPMKRNATLFHGTSKQRLQSILEEDCLRGYTVGTPAVCTSDHIEPALYWANLTAWTDTSDPVVIGLSSRKLLGKQYILARYSDPIYGVGKLDWEKEIRVRGSISPLAEVVEGYEEVPWSDIRRECPWRITMWANSDCDRGQ